MTATSIQDVNAETCCGGTYPEEVVRRTRSYREDPPGLSTRHNRAHHGLAVLTSQIEAIPPKATPAIGFDKVFYGAITAGASSKPYSRSHLKREKKKARQQVGGGLGSVAAALEEATEPAERLRVLKKGKAVPVVEVAPQKRKVEPDGRMGEGSARTPGEKQRRKQM